MDSVEEQRSRTPTGEVLARHSLGRRIGDVLATTDHKMVGYLYLATSFAFFLAGGLWLLTFVGLGFFVSSSRSTGSATLAERVAVARRPDVFGALLVTIIFMTGAFTIYT